MMRNEESTAQVSKLWKPVGSCFALIEIQSGGTKWKAVANSAGSAKLEIDGQQVQYEWLEETLEAAKKTAERFLQDAVPAPVLEAAIAAREGKTQ